MLQPIKEAMTGKEDDDGDDGGDGVAEAWWLPPRSSSEVEDDLEVLGEGFIMVEMETEV